MMMGWGILRGFRRVLLFPLLISLIMPAGCERIFPTRDRPNFIVIVVDTLRADRFERLRKGNTNTSNAKAFGGSAISFEKAYAATSWTIPSVASIFLSQYPSQHKAVFWESTLPEEGLTLAEILNRAGYATGLWSANILINKSRGFAQGFDTYEFVPGQAHEAGAPKKALPRWAPAAQLSSRAMQWLVDRKRTESDKPFFMYLHYMEPHTPYPCPRSAAESCKAKNKNLNRRLTGEAWKFTGEEEALISQMYDAGVEDAIAALEEVVEKLAAGGWLRNTWVVITADHGEMLGEHNYFVHGKTLYEPVTRVPLLFIGPGGKGATLTQPVSLIDLAPTILDLADLPRAKAFRGRSLAGALFGKPLEPQPVITEYFRLNGSTLHASGHRLAIINGSSKILLRKDGTARRFELNSDLREEHPLETTSAELKKNLDYAVQVVDLHGQSLPDREDLTPQAREELRALGYVQ